MNFITPSKQYEIFPVFSDFYNIEEQFKDHRCVKFKPALVGAIKKLEPIIKENFAQKKSRGRPSFSYEFMLKTLIAERFLGVTHNEMYRLMCTDAITMYLLDIVVPNDANIPKPKTLWKYSEIFSKKDGFMEECFNAVLNYAQELFPNIIKEDLLVDTSFKLAPVQRNTREENKTIKAGKGNELWQDNPNKARLKDIDARWTQKGGKDYFGYKDSAAVTAGSKFVTAVDTFPASVHDSKTVKNIITENDKNKRVYADSAYNGSSDLKEAQEKYNIQPKCISKAYKNKPLTREEKYMNKKLAKTRCRVEHVFGYIEQSMKGLIVRTVGITRAKANGFLTFLTYNLARIVQLGGIK